MNWMFLSFDIMVGSSSIITFFNFPYHINLLAVSYTHLDMYKRQVLPPLEDKQTAPTEEQPEVTTQTGEVNVPEKEKSKTMEENIMEMFRQMREDNKSMNQELKEDLKEDNRSTKEELGRKIENTNKRCV